MFFIQLYFIGKVLSYQKPHLKQLFVQALLLINNSALKCFDMPEPPFNDYKCAHCNGEVGT